MTRQNSIARYLCVLCCLLLVSTTQFANSVCADDSATNAQAESVWVTAISPIGSSGQFAAGTANGLLLRESTVMSFSATDTTAMSPLYSHPAAVWCVDSTSDGKTLASVDYRGNLVTYDVQSKKASTHEKVMERWCQTMLVAPDDKHVVAGNEAGKLMIWDLSANKIAKSVDLDEHAITGLAFSPDGKQLAASDGAGHVHLIKFPSLEEVGVIEVSEETVWCVAYNNEGDKLFAGSSDRNLYQMDAKPAAKPSSVAKGKDWITRIAISETGQIAASEVGGRLHFPSLGGADSMESKSGVWALCWNGAEQLIAGTRKDGLVTAGRSWKWTEAKKPEPEAKEEPAAEAEPATEPEKEMKPAEKSEPAKEKPAAKKPAKEKPAKEKPAKENADKKPAEKKTGDKPKKKEAAAKKKAAGKEKEAVKDTAKQPAQDVAKEADK